MKIGLISDTHGFLDPTVIKHFSQCDEVWHLGDIGSIELLESLQESYKVRAVYGNIDDHKIRISTEEYLSFDINGVRFLLIHIAGRVESYNKQVRELIDEYKPNILICGHSHILKVIQDKKYNLLHINPGAAGNHGFHKIKTLLRFDIADRRITNMEVIELGKRGALKK